MNYGAGFSGYVSAIVEWCKAAPHCVDLGNNAARITDGACASVSVGGGERDGEGDGDEDGDGEDTGVGAGGE